jgi:hypothetical protein
MARVYIFGAVMLVIALAATYFVFLAKGAQKMFQKKEKKNSE